MLMMDFMEGLVPGENYYGLTILGGWGAFKKGLLRYKMLGKCETEQATVAYILQCQQGHVAVPNCKEK